MPDYDEIDAQLITYIHLYMTGTEQGAQGLLDVCLACVAENVRLCLQTCPIEPIPDDLLDGAFDRAFPEGWTEHDVPEEVPEYAVIH